MATLHGTELAGRDTLVLGGTGNVGFFVVDGFLRAGARVIVPSRSPEKINRLKARLSHEGSQHVVAVPGNVGTPKGAESLGAMVGGLSDGLAAVAASTSGWHQNPSMMKAGFADFQHVIEASLYPHYLAAETFLPLIESDGSYTAINGPAGFVHSPFPGTGAISTAAAAQAMLIQAFARETEGHPRVNDVVMHAYMGPEGARRGSPLEGEQVGDFIAAVASPLGRNVHAQTLHVKHGHQVDDALHGSFATEGTNR
ncbi:SDR family NAD(P)-dependent oxidoreductase [Rothia uropygialis]|uniref:SDR family NAD(P)-dependent oxidoreductase n=1 Tax=Kocuria sp. 36 TaxID=1415402 RepID=UPI00101D8B9A|nr:SDR family NAD(P)-dependent oxidoreductase [Kocuria sp. 36]